MALLNAWNMSMLAAGLPKVAPSCTSIQTRGEGPLVAIGPSVPARIGLAHRSPLTPGPVRHHEGNLLVATVAGVVGASLVTEPENGGGVVAAIVVQAVTLPVLLARVAPAWAAGAQAAGVLLNEVAIGPMIRCGVTFPVMFVIVYQLGAADPAKHRIGRWLGIGACVATTAMELAFDPVLDSSSAIFVASLGLGFYGAGMVIRSRTRLVATLLRRTNELQEQRDRTAALEVAADRARVGADLERLIRAQIQAIGVSADGPRPRRTGTPTRSAPRFPWCRRCCGWHVRVRHTCGHRAST